jgi:hypothetical protein
MNDKRKFPRFGIASLAEITFPDSDDVIDAFISSISKGGLGIYSPQRLPVGQELNVKISFLQTNGNEEITEIIPGKVVWNKDFHNNFVIGIAFLTFDNLRHSLVLSYLEAAALGSA